MPTALAVPALVLLLAGAGIALAIGAAWPFPAGLAVATGIPLAFILGRIRSKRPLAHHPVAISAVSGLGSVTIMVGIQRFGPEPGWALPCALAGLVIWMLWQRDQRRSAASER